MSFRRLAGIALAIACAGETASSQAPGLGEVRVLVRRQIEAEKTYFAYLETPPKPSTRLTNLRRELSEVAKALIDNYDIRERYVTKKIAIRPGPDADASLSRITGVISTVIDGQEATRRRLARQLSQLEFDELVEPVNTARARWLAATDARDLALVRTEAAQGAMRVSQVRLVDRGGAAPSPVFSGEWRWDGEAAVEQVVVAGLEGTLAGVREDISELHRQNLNLAEQLHGSGRAWNAALQLAIKRADTRAVRDIALQLIGEAVDVTFSVATAGTWTVFRAVYTVGETVFRVRSGYLIGRDLRDTFTALEQDRVSKEIKAALLERIPADITNGRTIDVPSLMNRSAALPTTPSSLVGGEVYGEISREAAENAVSALIGYFENDAKLQLLTRVNLLKQTDYAPSVLSKLWMTSVSNQGTPTKDLVDLIKEHQTFNKVVAEELKAFGVSMGVMASTEAFSYLFDLFLVVNEPSDEQLARRMAMEELRIFVLSEAYRQSRALYDAQVLVEPILVERLALARHRLAAAGRRVFQTADGLRIDGSRGVEVGQVVGPLTFSADVEGARVPWRLDVSRVAGDRRQIIATATGRPGSQSVASATVESDRFLAVAVGPPAIIEIRVASSDPGKQAIDSDPTTPVSLDPRALAWTGWETGSDVYWCVATRSTGNPIVNDGIGPGQVVVRVPAGRPITATLQGVTAALRVEKAQAVVELRCGRREP